MTQRLLVVGGDAAGMSAASHAKRLVPDLEVIAFERGNHVSYSACGEPYLIGGEVSSIDRLVARTPQQFADQGIDVQLQTTVRGIDFDRRSVVVEKEGERTRIGFDFLMYSTGAAPARPDSIIGADRAYGLRSLDDAAQLRDVVDGGVKKAAVVGGGYIGLEAAEALCHRGVNVSLVTSGSHVLSGTIDPDIGAAANEACRRLGIELVLSAPVYGITAEGVATGGDTIPADFVVLGVGTDPEVELARETGIALGDSGAVAVNEFQETNLEGVWSAGDCAEATHRISRRQVNIALGTVANKAGRIAGANIAASMNGSAKARFPGVLGTAITKVGEVELARTGLTSRQAEAAGLEVVSGTVNGTNTAGYWPNAAPVELKVIADRATGRLVGAQIAGGPGSGKKIDGLAMALWTEMAVEDLAWVDLAYAPPFSGVWDLIHIASRRAAEARA
ncbi:FAD-dependent oxidoreductase [soil metagenome]